MTFLERTEKKKVSRKADGGRPAMEDNIWEQTLFADKLPDEFTDQVMLHLEGIEIEAVQEAPMSARPGRATHPTDTSIAAQLKRARNAQRAFTLKTWGAAAAALMLVGGTLLYTQPTLASMVRSLFAKDSLVDNGMKNVHDMGLVQISGVSAVDQGYRLQVNEVIADSTRLIIGIDVYDDKGNTIAGEIDYATSDFNIYFNERGNFADVSYDMRQGGNQTTNRMEFKFMRPLLTDKLQLNAHIKELRLYKDKLNAEPPVKEIKGDWKLIIEADLAKAKPLTLLTAIDQTYETPGGIQIHMQGASRTPSGGSLEFTTRLTPEAAGRAVNGQSGFHQLNFHLEDEQGKRLGDSTLFQLGRRYELERWSGVTQWFYQFDNFAYDKQKIRFVLDSYVIRERSTASVTFDPAAISAEQPAIFEDSGDKLLLQGLQIGPEPHADPAASQSDKTRAVIPFGGGGTVSHDIHGDTWVAVDETGKEYSMFVGGSVSIHESGAVEMHDGGFIIQDLKTMPKRLTIKRLIVNHQYRDADWSFVIPQTGTNGVVPVPE